ncbi:predicted protein [Nematostella vectensis]|uniref:CUB domain-containing protein n=1 Tax=Nematostella vectensis TaxID=45351 RepID=A7T0V3_NEMVE|nr:predicted protein [Nematostella vectensis]|eukprot:XP_001622511.1 predicted protein [Nematostella vectensis]
MVYKVYTKSCRAYCNSNRPPYAIISSSNQIRVWFNSDRTVSKKGFNATFTSHEDKGGAFSNKGFNATFTSHEDKGGAFSNKGFNATFTSHEDKGGAFSNKGFNATFTSHEDSGAFSNKGFNATFPSHEDSGAFSNKGFNATFTDHEDSGAFSNKGFNATFTSHEDSEYDSYSTRIYTTTRVRQVNTTAIPRVSTPRHAYDRQIRQLFHAYLHHDTCTTCKYDSYSTRIYTTTRVRQVNTTAIPRVSTPRHAYDSYSTRIYTATRVRQLNTTAIPRVSTPRHAYDSLIRQLFHAYLHHDTCTTGEYDSYSTRIYTTTRVRQCYEMEAKSRIKEKSNPEVGIGAATEAGILRFPPLFPQYPILMLLFAYRACGGVLKGPRGVMKSPRYMVSPYPNDANCEWVIEVEVGKFIRLSFVDFGLEVQCARCLCPDTLAIWDGAPNNETLIGSGSTTIGAMHHGSGYELTAQPIKGQRSSFGVSDDFTSLWSLFKDTGQLDARHSYGIHGSGVVTKALGPRQNGTLSLVMAWYYPFRDHSGELVGSYYR